MKIIKRSIVCLLTLCGSISCAFAQIAAVEVDKGAQKESVEEVRKLLEEQSERQEALLEEMNKNMKNISKNQKGKFSLFK